MCMEVKWMCQCWLANLLDKTSEMTSSEGSIKMGS